MLEFDKFWSVLQTAGFSDRGKKWAARAYLGALLCLALAGYAAYAKLNLFQEIPIDSPNAPPLAPQPVPPRAAEHPPQEIPHKQPAPKSRSISPTCSLVSRIAQDFNFEDGTHQIAAWQALENSLSQLPPQEKADVNLELVKEARNDWNGGAPSDALSKFVSAFQCP